MISKIEAPAKREKTMAPPDAPLPRPLLPPTYFVTEPDSRFEAVTDLGRTIPLFFFQPYIYPIEGEQLLFRPNSDGAVFLRMAEQTFLRNTKQNVASLDRVAGPSTRCNCHGWVFAEGEFLIQDAHVAAILADNGYSTVNDPRAGDIAVYQRDQLALHSGLVRANSTGRGALIESKWGPFGTFRHALGAHPFAGECKFYRSARSGHALIVRRKSED